MEELRFTVPGMTCGHCVAAVEGELAKVAGVTGVSVDLASKAVVVTGERLDLDVMKVAVDEAGYELVVPS
jgi:copper chaperone CopZ